MKLLLIFTLCLFFSVAKSQTNNKINNIKDLKYLNIYGANSKVSIGQIIINENSKPRLFLTAVNQSKDSLGIFHTKFTFTNPEKQLNGPVIIELRFNKPILEVRNMGSLVCMMENNGYSQDKKAYQYKCGQITAEYLEFDVSSTIPVLTTIVGIEGKTF